MTKGFKSAPPKAVDDQERERRMAEIISGTTATSPVPAPVAPTPTRLPMPWRDPKVRPDAMKQTNLRLSEPLAEKLDWLRKLSKRQKQDIVAEALAPYLNTKLREQGYSDDDL
jgi:hypothetical protein